MAVDPSAAPESAEDPHPASSENPVAAGRPSLADWARHNLRVTHPQLHRAVVFGAVALAALPWLWMLPAIQPLDGSTGLALVDSGIGLVPAALVMLVMAIPALALALLASAWGPRQSGIFAISLALTLVAALAGSPLGWLNRADLPIAYVTLIAELALWQLAIIGLWAAIHHSRPLLRARWPVAVIDHDDAPLGVGAGIEAGPTISAGIACAIIAALVAFPAIQSTLTGQVIGSLILAFAVATAVALAAFPKADLLAVLMAPGLVAFLAYLYVLISFGDEPSLRAAWYDRTLPITHRLPGPCIALPIHYASAGVLGCAIGANWARALLANDKSQPDETDSRAKPVKPAKPAKPAKAGNTEPAGRGPG